MRIVVNDIAASSGGALTVLKSFYRYVRDFDQGNEWIFLLGGDLLDETSHIRTIVLPEVKNSWLRRLYFDLISGRRLISQLMPDSVLSLQNTYTYGLRCPQIVYVHQSLPFQRSQTFRPWRRDERLLAVYQYFIGAVIKQSIRRSDHVIVQTRWMRDAIREQVGKESVRVTCVPPDRDDLSAYTLKRSINSSANFIYPTADHIYKNNGCVYSACRLLRSQGVVDFKVTMTLAPPSPDPNVESIGRVPREQVLRVLSRSALVFPSLIETYGLPLAEARALGATVLAADLPYAREALEGYENAYYFDPSSPEELATLMKKVIGGTLVKTRATSGDRSSDCSSETAAWSQVLEVLRSNVRETQREK